MIRFVLSLTILIFLLTTDAFGQQTFNSVKIKELQMPTETQSRATVIDATGKLKSSTTTSAELEMIQGLSSNAQTQIDGLDTRLDTAETDINAVETSLTTHESDTTTHGTTGNIVGTTDTQTLTNKTITGASIQSPSRLDPKKDTKTNLETYATTAQNGELVFATDEKKQYQVIDGALTEIAGGGSGVGSTDVLYVMDFEDAIVGDFDSFSGWTLGGGLNGLVGAEVTHATASTTKEFADTISPIPEKFVSKNLTLKITAKSTASDSNLVLDVGCSTYTDILNGDPIQFSVATGGAVSYHAFDVPSDCSSLSYKVRALPETGPPASDVDDIEIGLTTFDEFSAVVQDADSIVRVDTANGFGSTATMIRRFSTIREVKGTAITYADSATNGASFTINEAGIYHISYMEYQTGAGTIGISLNSTNLTTQVGPLSITTNNEVLAAITNASSYDSPVSWSGYLNVGDVIRPHTNGLAAADNDTIKFTIAKQSSLKQIKVNSNQKVKIPTSYLMLNNGSGVGSTNTGIAKFLAVEKLEGDAFDIDPLGSSTTLGTHIRMRKNGILNVSVVATSSGGAASHYISRNQSVLTTVPTNAEILNAASNSSGGIFSSPHWEGTVKTGDIIRLSTNASTSFNGSQFVFSFQEQEVQVSVSNTLPQFSDEDVILKTAGNAGQAVGLNAAIPFNTISDSTGGWNGTQFTIPSDGLYTISGSTYWTDSANRSNVLYVDGVAYKRLSNQPASLSNAYPFNSITEKFTAGQVLSIRIDSLAGTLTNNATSNLYHYLNITKVGKPNVTGVDVTPFVNVAREERQVMRRTTGGTTAINNDALLTTLYSNVGDNIFSYNSSNGRFTLLKNATVNLEASFFSGAAGDLYPLIKKNGTTIRSVNYGNGGITSANYGGAISVNDYGVAGDYYTFSPSGQGASSIHVSISATATSDQVITPVESFSTDTATLTFASSSTYTLSTLTNAPDGTFITFTSSASSNTRTQCTTAPTQTTTDMNANGFLIYTRAYNAASTCAQPAAFAMKIGRGFKGVQRTIYKSTGKANAGFLDLIRYSAENYYGATFNDYNESTGILIVDANYIPNSANTDRKFLFSDISEQASGYVVVHASKVPSLGGVAPAQNRIAILTEEYVSGTAAPSIQTTYTARRLNTIRGDSSFITNSSSFAGVGGTNTSITLEAGTYKIDVQAMGHVSTTTAVLTHKIKLYNTTDSTDVIIGTTGLDSNNAGGINDISPTSLKGFFTITSPKTFEIRHRGSSVQNTGAPASFGDNEVYLTAEIQKIK
jgi:hypothetical protein